MYRGLRNMAKGQKGVYVVMCAERVIGNLMDSANGFHAPEPDLDVKQKNNDPRNDKVFDHFFARIKFPRIHLTVICRSLTDNYSVRFFFSIQNRIRTRAMTVG
jgi:hypothetical protein